MFLIIHKIIKCGHSHSLQSSLPAQILSALINTVCLNSSKMFMIVKLRSCMGPSQIAMMSMFSFNTRTVPILQHIDKSWLKTLISSNNESLSKCFLRALLRFFNVSCDFSELYVTASKRGQNKRLVYTDSQYIFTHINRA